MYNCCVELRIDVVIETFNFKPNKHALYGVIPYGKWTMKNKYHTVRTVPNSDQKIVETEA